MKKVLTGFNIVNPKGEVVYHHDLPSEVDLLNLRVVPVIETRGDPPRYDDPVPRPAIEPIPESVLTPEEEANESETIANQ